MIRPTISVKNILEKLFRTFNFKDLGRIEDMKEFIMEGLSEAYIHSNKEIVTEKFIIENYKLKYPKFCIGVVNIFDDKGVPALLFEITEAFANTDNYKNRYKGDTNLYYQIQPNYFKFSKTDIQVSIEYSRYVLDCDGFPTIPDIEVIKEYLNWHIIYKLILGGYNHPVVNFQLADAKRREYLAKAQNADIDTGFKKMEEVFDSLWIPVHSKNNRTL